jgi:hypothetical protein
MPDSTCCPYCGTILTAKPTRKKNCPQCGQAIYVRRGNLLTEAQVVEYDEQQHIDAWVSTFARLGVTRAKFDRTRERLSEQLHLHAPVNDTKWAVLNALVTTKRTPRDLVDIYREMIRIVEVEGKDSTGLRAERDKWIEEAMRSAFEREMRDKREFLSSFGFVVIANTSGDDQVCPHCKAVSERHYSFDEFQALLPIPRGCQNPDGCRCWFTFGML